MSQALITSMVGIGVSLGPKAISHLHILKACESSLMSGLIESFSNSILLLCVGGQYFDCGASFLQPFQQWAIDKLSTTVEPDNLDLSPCSCFELHDECFDFITCITFKLQESLPAHLTAVVNDSKCKLVATNSGGLKRSLEVHMESVKDLLYLQGFLWEGSLVMLSFHTAITWPKSI